MAQEKTHLSNNKTVLQITHLKCVFSNDKSPSVLPLREIKGLESRLS